MRQPGVWVELGVRSVLCVLCVLLCVRCIHIVTVAVESLVIHGASLPLIGCVAQLAGD